MDNITREVLRTKIKGLKGTAFQDALDRINFCIYGTSGYQRLKQKNDGGSDGIVNGYTILAAYAPEQYRLNNFKKKVRGDYESYTKNWATTHPGWRVVTNLESNKSMIQFVEGLKQDASIMCIESLLQLISEQTWTVKMHIFKALEISDYYISNDLMSQIIEDLIQNSEQDKDFDPYERPAYIQDKIELNVSEENQSVFMDSYEESLAFFSNISNVVKSNSQENISAIRNNIRTTFMGLSGSFEDKMTTLVKLMAKDKQNDQYYVNNMYMVMLYFFEQCLYGLKPESEVIND